MSTFSPGIPTGLVFLDQDYKNIQNNMQQLDNSMTVNHTAFSVNTSSNPAGYHKNINMIPVSSTTTNPPDNQPINGYTATVGFGQILSAGINDGINTDEALYWLTGGNRLIQMTRNFVPVAATNGYTFLPGGLMVIWGTIAPNSSTTNTVKFTGSGGLGLIQFPNNIFNIQVTRQRPTGDPGSSYEYYVDNSTVTTNGFNIINRDGHSYGYYWQAWGN